MVCRSNASGLSIVASNADAAPRSALARSKPVMRCSSEAIIVTAKRIAKSSACTSASRSSRIFALHRVSWLSRDGSGGGSGRRVRARRLLVGR